MRYEVDPAELAEEARDLGEAAGQLGGVTAVVALGVLRQALPGGATAGATSGIQQVWREDLAASRAALRSFATAMGAAASGYEQVEAAAGRAFDAAS